MASASAAARLCILACRRAPQQIHAIPRVHQAARQSPVSPLARRAFTTSTTRRARDEVEDEEDAGPLVLKKLDAALAESSTSADLQHLDELAKENGFHSIDAYLENTLEHSPGWASEDRALLDELRKDDIGTRPNKQSFWFDEEDPETNTDELDEFDEDDITSMAHGKLDQIREMRHYARLAVWEMPLLSKLAKPFVPPGKKEVLRWRYTSYMGESHPAEKKVVVQFSPRDLNLKWEATEKLKKLAGPRYNPEKNLVKMSCESFEHQAQNKRFLLDQVETLIAAANDPTDDFHDVPLDTRHHESVKKPRFPVEWRMTKKRVAELETVRQQAALADLKRAETGLLVDGAQAIEGFLMRKSAEEREKEKLAELVPVSAKSGGETAPGDERGQRASC